jgi:putative peptidoglycan lipid II flippase
LAIVVIALILGGIAIYGLFLALLGVLRWDEAAHAIRETAPSRLRD